MVAVLLREVVGHWGCFPCLVLALKSFGTLSKLVFVVQRAPKV